MDIRKLIFNIESNIIKYMHQWYWEYEYADFLNEENETINFDSYMKDEASLEEGELRMLEVDNAVVLPIDTHIRFIITGADVLHDWAVPALALKVDAAPGQIYNYECTIIFN